MPDIFYIAFAVSIVAGFFLYKIVKFLKSKIRWIIAGLPLAATTAFTGGPIEGKLYHLMKLLS